MNPIQHQAIVDFARHVLGCQCAEEVFRSIKLDTMPAVEGLPAYRRIVIGERLLIYVVQAQQDSDLLASIPALAATGIRERDRRGYNRFRLVISTDAPEAESPFLAKFIESAGNDEKAHLHWVARVDLPDMTSSDLN